MLAAAGDRLEEQFRRFGFQGDVADFIHEQQWAAGSRFNFAARRLVRWAAASCNRLTHSCQDATERETSDGVVVAFIFVVVEPGVPGVCSLGDAGERLAVGPFGLQSPVEALDLSLLPGTVGADEDVAGAEDFQGTLEVSGQGVVGHIVGHDLAHGANTHDKGRAGMVEESRAGRPPLVGVGLGVGQARVVVDCGEDVVKPDSPARVIVSTVASGRHVTA